MPAELRIGGFSPLSSCDWPGELVATVFCRGCSWRCAYCHNQALQCATAPSAMAWPAVSALLQKRAGLLDGVVFSGGEPLLQCGLEAAVEEVRALGFKAGLHTGGAVPERFAGILPLLDWVGFDFKAPFADYAGVTGVTGSGDEARDCLHRLLASGTAYEIRTTVHPQLLDGATLLQMAQSLMALGIRRWVLQPYRAFPGAERQAENYDATTMAALHDCGLEAVWR